MLGSTISNQNSSSAPAPIAETSQARGTDQPKPPAKAGSSWPIAATIANTDQAVCVTQSQLLSNGIDRPRATRITAAIRAVVTSAANRTGGCPA